MQPAKGLFIPAGKEALTVEWQPEQQVEML